ncbi:MAG: hypothetical protein NTW25_15675 [Candidatus Kapabacteria bacterium]|nr:hypothetical protein [Candidatus Kapabacteria bacterium]
MIEQVSYNPDGSMTSKYTYKYDEKGNIVEKVNYTKSGEPSLRNEFIYSK